MLGYCLAVCWLVYDEKARELMHSTSIVKHVFTERVFYRFYDYWFTVTSLDKRWLDSPNQPYDIVGNGYFRFVKLSSAYVCQTAESSPRCLSLYNSSAH